MLGEARGLVLVDALGIVLFNALGVVLVDMLVMCNPSCKELKNQSRTSANRSRIRFANVKFII